MNETQFSNETHKSGFYEIRIKGHLADRWVFWFEGLNIKLEDRVDNTSVTKDRNDDLVRSTFSSSIYSCMNSIIFALVSSLDIVSCFDSGASAI